MPHQKLEIIQVTTSDKVPEFLNKDFKRATSFSACQHMHSVANACIDAGLTVLLFETTYPSGRVGVTHYAITDGNHVVELSYDWGVSVGGVYEQSQRNGTGWSITKNEFNTIPALVKHWLKLPVPNWIQPSINSGGMFSPLRRPYKLDLAQYLSKRGLHSAGTMYMLSMAARFPDVTHT